MEEGGGGTMDDVNGGVSRPGKAHRLTKTIMVNIRLSPPSFLSALTDGVSSSRTAGTPDAWVAAAWVANAGAFGVGDSFWMEVPPSLSWGGFFFFPLVLLLFF